MILNKRTRVVEELWRDFPELRWHATSYGDIDGYGCDDLLYVWYRSVNHNRWRWKVSYRIHASRQPSSLEGAQRIYLDQLEKYGETDGSE